MPEMTPERIAELRDCDLSEWTSVDVREVFKAYESLQAELQSARDLREAYKSSRDIVQQELRLAKDRADKAEAKLKERADEVTKLKAEVERLTTAILNAHGKGLPPSWVYTDSTTSLDLLVAECLTLRKELNIAGDETENAKATIRELRAINVQEGISLGIVYDWYRRLEFALNQLQQIRERIAGLIPYPPTHQIGFNAAIRDVLSIINSIAGAPTQPLADPTAESDAVESAVVFCPSCRKRGEPVKCWVCKMEMCLRCAKPHGAKSVCDRCLRTL